MVHHRRDTCRHTLPAGVQPFLDWSKGKATVKWLDGGTAEGDPCQARGHHGFNGIDAQVVDAVGLDYLFAVYDTDGDGLISRSELLADVRLDERPIGTVLLDPQALDHAAIGRRLGLPPSVLEQLPLDQAN